MDPVQTTLKARDIKCEGCAAAARAALAKVPGVRGTAVDVPGQTVTVTHDPGTPRTELSSALTRAGFPAE